MEPLEQDRFNPYGRVIDIPNSHPTKTGVGWQCWNYIEMMQVDTEVGVGMVRTQMRPFVVEEMERHDSREEVLLAIDEDILQPVAMYHELYDPNEKPDAEKVQVFHIKKGQGIILNKGIWHSPAYPAYEETTYLFGIENKKDRYGDEILNPWVGFENDESVAFGK